MGVLVCVQEAASHANNVALSSFLWLEEAIVLGVESALRLVLAGFGRPGSATGLLVVVCPMQEARDPKLRKIQHEMSSSLPGLLQEQNFTASFLSFHTGPAQWVLMWGWGREGSACLCGVEAPGSHEHLKRGQTSEGSQLEHFRRANGGGDCWSPWGGVSTGPCRLLPSQEPCGVLRCRRQGGVLMWGFRDPRGQ